MAALILATIALVPIGGILYRLLRFWGGARGRSPSERSRTPDSVVSWPPIYDAQVTAANVAAIRSDLDAVSRQMQD
jgi:hypothetical protein